MKPLGVLAVNRFANYGTISTAINKVGHDYIFISDPSQLSTISGLIIPGVGSFSSLAAKITRPEWLREFDSLIQKNFPIFGICLGMQILFESSEEILGGINRLKGLSIFPGSVLPVSPDKKPVFGFRKIKPNSAFLNNSMDNNSYYFMHSYSVHPSDTSIITSTYCLDSSLIVSSIQSRNIFGVQFHPECSNLQGLELFSNFLSVCKTSSFA